MRASKTMTAASFFAGIAMCLAFGCEAEGQQGQTGAEGQAGPEGQAGLMGIPGLPGDGLGFVNVRSERYGAVGDGVADDTAALQLALDDAGTSGVGVYMPAGRYRITEGLEFHYSGQLTLVGNGPTSTFIVPDYNDPSDYVLDIHPASSGDGGSVIAALLQHFRIQWEDSVSGSQTPSMSKGIRLSGVSGSTLINNVKLKNGPQVLLHLRSGTLDGDNYYKFLEHFTVENSAFLGRGGDTPNLYTEPIILADGLEKSLQIRFQRNIIGGGRQSRTHIRVVRGEQWTISDNKFRSIRNATSIHIGDGTTSAPMGFRIFSNGFENIVQDAPSKDQAILYLQGDSGFQAEHPFIGYNTFIFPSTRDIYLENIQNALVVEQAISQNDVHLIGAVDRCRDNKIMALGGNFSPTDFSNSFLYSNNHGMAATSGFSAYRNKRIDSSGATRNPFFEWGVVESDGVLSENGAITEMTGGDDATSPSLETRVGGDTTLTLTPGRAVVESLGVGNSIQHAAPVAGATAHAIEVFDKNGNSLGFIPVYTNPW